MPHKKYTSVKQTHTWITIHTHQSTHALKILLKHPNRKLKTLSMNEKKISVPVKDGLVIGGWLHMGDRLKRRSSKRC